MMKTIFALTLLALPSLTVAQGVRYAVQNRTGGLGGATYPVTTPVTFSALSITLLFADSTTQTDAMPGTVAVSAFKNSAVYPLIDPVHGAITTATISGIFSTVNWQESPTFAGAKTAVTVSNPFSASVVGGVFRFAYIDGTDTTSGLSYHAGNLSSGPSTLPVTPEPGAAVLLISAGIAAALCARRRRRHCSVSSDIPS